MCCDRALVISLNTYKNHLNWALGLLFLKLSLFLGYIDLSLFLFFPPLLKIFHNAVMIRNRSSDTTESQRKRPVLMLISSTVS